jgi:hypothetical protein
MKLVEENAQVDDAMERYVGAENESTEDEEEFTHQSLMEEHHAEELALRATSFLNDFCLGVDFDNVHNAEVILFYFV